MYLIVEVQNMVRDGSGNITGVETFFLGGGVCAPTLPFIERGAHPDFTNVPRGHPDFAKWYISNKLKYLK